MIRLFIAMPLGQDAESKLGELIARCRQEGGSVKWVKPENIHLTIRFLGDTDEHLVPKLSKMLDEVAFPFSPVETVMDRVGGFPNLKRPRVIWTSIGDNMEPIAKLARQVELHVRRLRFEPEKRGFKAHLTLGRVRQPQGLDRLLAFLSEYQLEPIPLRLDRLRLYKSTLTPTGPIYDCLHETPLGQERLEG